MTTTFLNILKTNSNSYDEFGRKIIDVCLKICEDGEKTQTTCTGVAQAIRQRFGILPPKKDLLKDMEDARELFKPSHLSRLLEDAICEIESLRMERRND